MTDNAASMDRDRYYWDRHARNYGMSMRILGRPMPRMCALIAEELREDYNVLEVGAGTGLVTVIAARVARHVAATDYSEGMVQELRANLERAGITNVECLTRDIYDLGFEARSFDAVICANVLHLVPDLPGALAALAAMLRPGGILIAPTFCHAETWYSRTLSQILALTGFPGARRFTAASLRASLERAGLRTTRQETIAGAIPIGFVSGRFSAGRQP